MLARILCFLSFLFLTASEQSFANLYDFKTFSLENGLKVYVLENKRIPVVGLLVGYKVGSTNDPLRKSGLAHFLEHMMFKGPKGSGSSLIMEDVQKSGGTINAVTSYDMTFFYEIVPKEHLETVMAHEASRMLNLVALPDQALSERNVVLEEENMRIGNNPLTHFMLDLQANFYKEHPYRIPSIGTRNDIKTYTAEDVMNFHKQWYAPNNAFVIISGDLTVQQAKDLVTRHFGPIQARPTPTKEKVDEPPLDTIIEITKKTDKIAQPYVAYLFPAPSLDLQAPQQAFSIDLLSYALCNAETGLLYRRLVDDLRVAASISMQYDMHMLDATEITLVAQAAPGVKAAILDAAIRQELGEILKNKLTQNQLDKFKLQILSNLDYTKDSLLSGADHAIAPLIKNVPLDQIENWPKQTQELSLTDVNAALLKFFAPTFYVKGFLVPNKQEEETLSPKTGEKRAP